ncbi:MAG TPA: FMN-binding negative transcriptional regulator [Chitinophagaceae bacterium]|nr:FMN-binding negative transcriptional regulator [Chitinophagaceae bacterium]
MYHLPRHKEPDPLIIKTFMQQHPFVLLTGCNSRHEPVATQVPVFMDEKEGRLSLTGHIMKQTDHYEAFLQNPNVLALFTGPHTYVSASWYTNKQQGSTWNYISVHARGTLRFLPEEQLRQVLQRTTDHFENNPHSGANFKDLPEEYINRLIKAIAAFEIAVEKLDHVFKLSQDRDEKSYDNIIHHLQQQEGDAASIAAIMNSRKEKVFPA